MMIPRGKNANETVEYAGAAFFRLSRGVIEEGWAVGDTQALWRAGGKL